MANTTVSEYEPTGQTVRIGVKGTVMFCCCLAARVPLVAEKVSQLEVLVADQTIATAPVLLSVYVWLEGLNGPPAPPLESIPTPG